MLGDRLGWIIGRAKYGMWPGEDETKWWTSLPSEEKAEHLLCAIRELHGQVHHQKVGSGRTIHHLWKRVGEQEQEIAAAIARAEKAEAELARLKAPTETRDEWHARRCPGRIDWPAFGCEFVDRCWKGDVERYDYGPNREFVNRTCAEVYEDEQAEQRFTTWHAQECIWKRLEPNSKFGCNGHELWNISGAAARMDKRFANRTCYNVYEAEVLNRLGDR